MTYACSFGGMYGGNMLFGFLWWIILILIIVWIVLWFSKKGNLKENPLNILKKRHAKGEITKKQFNDMKKELRRS